jgi:hypothetical protein
VREAGNDDLGVQGPSGRGLLSGLTVRRVSQGVHPAAVKIYKCSQMDSLAELIRHSVRGAVVRLSATGVCS